ncbi:MAG: hypothetical protein LBO78_02140 [Rickettsiales bacterium]|jgi:hypothetical protein|nr:hypothetical protein [Rickettsiales bacterium]
MKNIEKDFGGFSTEWTQKQEAKPKPARRAQTDDDIIAAVMNEYGFLINSGDDKNVFVLTPSNEIEKRIVVEDSGSGLGDSAVPCVAYGRLMRHMSGLPKGYLAVVKERSEPKGRAYAMISDVLKSRGRQKA